MMKVHKIHIFLYFILMFFGVKLSAQDTKLCVIANAKGCPQELKMRDLKTVLLGEKQRWNGSTPVVIALMKSNTPIGGAIADKIYNMSPLEMNKYWLALVFQGRARAPSFFSSVSELQSFVAQTPGAIGVIEADEKSITPSVLVDGKKEF